MRQLSILAVLTVTCVTAQRIDWLEHTTGWNLINVQTDMVVDHQGNVILAGEYSGGSVNAFGTMLLPMGLQDGFVVKLDPDGQPLWVERFASGDNEHINDLAVDSAGNIYLQVRSSGFGTTFNAHSTVIDLSSGMRDLLIKIAPDGEVLNWRPSATSMNIDCAWGDVFAVYGTVPASLYLERMDGGMQTVWLDTLGTLDFVPEAMDVDTAGHIALVGKEYTRDVMEYQGIIVPNDPVDQNEGVVARFDLDGDLQWVRCFGAMNTIGERGRSISIGPGGEVYVGTGSDTTFTFAGQAFPAIEGMSGQVALLLAYDGQGNEDWAVPSYSQNPIPGFFATMVDQAGNVLAAAQQVENGIVHGVPVTGLSMPLALVKCTPQGDLIWLKQPMPGADYFNTTVFDIGQSPDGAYYLGGYGHYYYLDCIFDPTSTARSYYAMRLVEEPIIGPEAAFAYTMTGLEVQFTDASQNVTDWHWTFGDGADTTVQSPVHEYQSGGTYNVTLTAGFGICADTLTDTITLISTGLEHAGTAYTGVQVSGIDGTLVISIPGTEAARVDVVDAIGRLFLSEQEANGATVRRTLVSGVYRALITGRDGLSVQSIFVP